ncbi:DNA starvation/stationary phase protection protein [Maribellus comscasis]|uniref:DNA starvation/stationary phase protection protein n=1 Tax=Maribellus comscasis TaxID=2681766 RepID=A0A6I6JYJ7_9BACT|nr:DNA starvation/stationary phase protection protein [Maribellus comscasis]QGY47631.1 DNA starvation/stationary phase protection protein [Maribellus comscasis]
MNNIGLKEDYTKVMEERLNAYLSSVQISYMNVRGYHWNIIGKQFFALHEKFEEIYNSLNEMADEIAERILMLEGKPLHSFSEYIKVSVIKERQNVNSAEDTVNALLEDTAKLLETEREILSLASDNDDEGTASLMSGFIGEQEKMIWMFNALLK